MKLFFANVDFDVTESELRALFEAQGQVFRFCLLTNHVTKKSRGFGFCTMRADDGRKAIAALHGRRVKSRVLDVRVAT
jgi:RNA recognition motif-containing protein